MVSNQELGKIFEEISEVLELQGGDRFRIVAFQNAAQTIKSYGKPLELIYESEGTKGLQKVPGIGEGIADRIEEYLKFGRIKDFEQLTKRSPEAELEFMRIPGVGPKTAVKLYRELGAKNLRDLSKRLSKSPGKVFKEKTTQKILKGIEAYKNLGGRVLLADALPVAEEIVAYLEKLPGCDKVVAVGSLRRRKETVGDVDIVASADAPAKTIAAFVKYPDFKQIINQGETKSAAIHRSGLQIDLEILPRDEYGSLLQHFTGSKQHNVALRTFAQEHGWSVSEHGIKLMHEKRKGRLIKCATEEEVYRTLGMDYIEPELREDHGELEAALKHALPHLVELKDIKGDLHVHSNWSDSKDTIAEIATKAHELGYKYLAIADHTVGLGVARGLDGKKFALRDKEIIRTQKKFSRLKILSSCEVNILASGELDLPEGVLKRFDLVTASVHSAFSQSKEVMTRRIIKALEKNHVNILGHPTGRLINRREGYEVDWPALFKACVDNKIALEVNAFPDRLDLTDTLIQEAKKYGLKLAINTDAHAAEHLDFMDYGVSTARRGWAQAKDIVNTLSLSELLKVLGR